MMRVGTTSLSKCRPPRGGRGLKQEVGAAIATMTKVAPRVGGAD